MLKSSNSYIAIESTEDYFIMQVYVSCKTKIENGWHFACCPELGLMDQGYSKREAIENLILMVRETLIEALETGNLDAMLKELGFNKRTQRTRKRYTSSIDAFEELYPIKFDVEVENTSERTTATR